MATKFLTALPVYNEARHVGPVLDEVLRYSPNVLVVDDGSTDGTSELLARRVDIQVVRHEKNRGYGAGLKSAFAYALAHGYDTLVTIDCDGQHQPRMIPDFVTASAGADIVSGSRYLKHFEGDSVPPPERLKINRMLTDVLNRRLGLQLTDAFCGFKSYRAEALTHFDIDELGYAMPIEVWVQAVQAGLENCRASGSLDLPGRSSIFWRGAGQRRHAIGLLSNGARSLPGGTVKPPGRV